MTDSATKPALAEPAAAPAPVAPNAGDAAPAAKPKAAKSQTALGQAVGEEAPKPVIKEEAKAAAPEVLDIKIPAGVSIDASMLESFKVVAGEVGLTSETATKLVEWQSRQQAELNDANADNWTKQGEQWAEELQNHAEFGGDKFEGTLLNARKALRKYGGDDVASQLDDMGLGNHPGLVHMFARIGASMGEDNADTGGKSSSGPSTLDEKLSNFYNKSG